MSMRYIAMAATGMMLAGNALAVEGEALAERSNCMQCHAMASKSTGPSFQEISAKYRNDKGAQAMLEKKVRNGSAGTWGKIPMPATARSVSDEEIRVIVKWLLALK